MSDEPRNLPEDFLTPGDGNQPPTPTQQPYSQPSPQPWTQPSADNPYGRPPADPYAPYAAPPTTPPSTPYAPAGASALPPHPNATTALVLGLVGLVGGVMCCGVTLVLSPFAWWLGGSAVRETRAEPHRYGSGGTARAGQVLGIIGTVLAVLAALALVAFFAYAFTLEPGSSTDFGTTDRETEF